MDAGGSIAHLIVVGDVARALEFSEEPSDPLDGVGEGHAVRVTRTVLRSEVLRILLAGRVDMIITASDASFLARDEFLAAIAARTAPVTVLMLTPEVDERALSRLRSVGAQVEHVPPPVAPQGLQERVGRALRQRRRATMAAREPLAPTTARGDLPVAIDEATGVTAQATGPPEGAALPTTIEAEPPAPERTTNEQTAARHGNSEQDMANIHKTLEETMKIDGAIGAAIADWDSGLCLGTIGGGPRLNLEVAAAGNCQVVKAKMATMAELGIKGSIQDILITLDDQIHLIRPLRRVENMFMYLAIDKAKGNLAMARHRLSKLETELDF